MECLHLGPLYIPWLGHCIIIVLPRQGWFIHRDYTMSPCFKFGANAHTSLTPAVQALFKLLHILGAFSQKLSKSSPYTPLRLAAQSVSCRKSLSQAPSLERSDSGTRRLIIGLHVHLSPDRLLILRSLKTLRVGPMDLPQQCKTEYIGQSRRGPVRARELA